MNGVGPTTGTSEPKPNPLEELPTLRTYKQDLAENVRGGDVSIASIALAEQRKRDTTVGVEKEVRTSKILVILISIFVLGGAITLAYVLFLRGNPVQDVPIEPALTLPKPLVQSQSQALFDVTGKNPDTAYKSLASKVKLASGPANSIEDVVLTKSDNLLSAEEFFTSLGIPIPERVIRFVDKKYMFGIYRGSGSSAFIMLRPTSFGPVFSEMLNWEGEMPRYIYPLLTGIPLSPDTQLTWDNYVVKNVDVREGKNSGGTILLLYSFLPDKSTLIIAPDLATFSEVLLRAQSPMPITQ